MGLRNTTPTTFNLVKFIFLKGLSFIIVILYCNQIKQMTNSEKRTALLTAGTEFTVNINKWKSDETLFKINRFNPKEEDSNPAAGLAVGTVQISFNSMNIKSVGRTKITFYTFNMFGTQSKQVIKFEDIVITKTGTEES